MLEKFRLLSNKIRIWFLRIFTDRVKDIKITDETGKDHNFTIEKQQEKTCEHKHLELVYPTIWLCSDCQQVYFIIHHWLSADRSEMLKLLEGIAKHFKAKLADDDNEQAKK